MGILVLFCGFKKYKTLIYLFQIELLEMEKTQLGFQCEELKAEVAQLKASIPHANDSVASNIEDPVNYSDGERYYFFTVK